MRFIADGPSIPDELLWARDQGRVVFFCGAGVSRAKANLPDFFGLAEKVTNKLGVPADSPIFKILHEAKTLGSKTGVDGLISADRIFGLLEREFLQSDINAAVAAALKPDNNCDLSAHKILTKLATTRDGLVRLVTTNFDRLFDNCVIGRRTFMPPKLPDPARPKELNGVVYLHGRATECYDGAEGDGFVLSSSEFGRAYLADGWATNFFREIIDKYSVVFIGYAADDPPVQYLLEALNKTAGQLEGVYAFQSGEASYATARWRHKGVEAIPYDAADSHFALWQTLESWSERAENPEAWMEKLVDLARRGPEQLQPFQRGQVAHLVGTVEGARKFLDGNSPPPATWLCVFDQFQRYRKPGKAGRFEDGGEFVDPFDLFGLDTDSVPSKVDPENFYARRETPKQSWSAFTLNKLDRLDLRDENISSIRGHWAENVPRLPARLDVIADWIVNVSNQPAAAWWAGQQDGLHQSIKDRIIWSFKIIDKENFQNTVQIAWQFVIDSWGNSHKRSSREWFEISDYIEASGWNSSTVRLYGSASKPHLKAESAYSGCPIPPTAVADLELRDLVALDVEYPEVPQNPQIPNEWLPSVVGHIRRNLEIAVELETEIGGYGLYHIGPIIADGDSVGVNHSRSSGLTGWIVHFAELFQKLADADPAAATLEYSRWDQRDETIFSRLRVWAASLPSVVSNAEFQRVLSSLTDEVFWDHDHSRDLMLTLSSRWERLSKVRRKHIEDRIRSGPPKWDDEQDDRYKARRARRVLNRLHWLQKNGCILSFNWEADAADLIEAAPDWKEEYATSEIQSNETKVGWVRTETAHSDLLMEPVGNILAKALEISRVRTVEFTKNDPFAGLAQEHPLRAFAALRHAAKKGDFPEWAWKTFLNSEKRSEDKARFTSFIAAQVLAYDVDHISTLIRPLANWIQKAAKVLASASPRLLSAIIQKSNTVLSLQPPDGKSAIIRTNAIPDWTMEAINSPTGDLAEALFDHPLIKNLKNGTGLPTEWLELAEAFFLLPGDMRKHAVVIFSYKINWLYYIDPDWTKKHLISVLELNDGEDKEALWAGFLWSGDARGYEFFELIKPHVLHLAKKGDLEQKGHAETLAGLILSAWSLTNGHLGERWVTDDELRDVLLHSDDNFRTRILWQTERWASENEPDTEKWARLTTRLLRDVWPRQIVAMSPKISVRMCDLAFSNADQFEERVQIILPVVTRAENEDLYLPALRKSKDNIVDLYPKSLLSLLHAILPTDAKHWPYGIESIISRISEADPSLANDERLIELQRNWNSR